jgi:hypothetical protein
LLIEEPDCYVASCTEQTANLVRIVIVVYCKIALVRLRLLADFTNAVLFREHAFVIFEGDTETGSELASLV